MNIKIKLHKESENEFKQRVSSGEYQFLSTPRVIPSKKLYTRKLKYMGDNYVKYN